MRQVQITRYTIERGQVTSEQSIILDVPDMYQLDHDEEGYVSANMWIKDMLDVMGIDNAWPNVDNLALKWCYFAYLTKSGHVTIRAI
jgi:hypothetical protein